LITALQTLVSREVNPVHLSVVTIGRVEAGSAANAIAETATLHSMAGDDMSITRSLAQAAVFLLINVNCAGDGLAIIKLSVTENTKNPGSHGYHRN
jgi:hypothetical protein